MYPNTDIQEILEVLCASIVATLGDNFEGIYLKGSLALGDFNPETSDVDLLIVVKQALDQADFERLERMHQHLQTLPNRYAHEVELAYVPASILNSFVPGRKYPALGRGEQLKWKALGTNWILEFWTVREHGSALSGPDPKTLIDPISSEEIVGAVRGVMPDWLEWVNTWNDPQWHPNLGTMRFAVETMCRVLYTLATGEMCSKPKAVAWALGNLPEPGHSLVVQSQSWSPNQPTSPAINALVMEFVRYAAERLNSP